MNYSSIAKLGFVGVMLQCTQVFSAPAPSADPQSGFQTVSDSHHTITGIDTSSGDQSSRVVGHFSGTLQLGSVQMQSRGDYDIFVAKYSKDNQMQWVVPMGGTGRDGGAVVAAQGDGTTYVVGIFTQSIAIGPDGPDAIVVDSGSENDTGIFLAQISAQGKVKWAQRIGTRDSLNDWKEAPITAPYFVESRLHVLKDGSVFVLFSNRPTHFKDRSDTYNGHFLNRYDSQGRLLSSAEIYDSGYSYPKFTAVLKDETILVYGSCPYRNVVFSPGQEDQKTYSCEDNRPQYVARYTNKLKFMDVREVKIDGLEVTGMAALADGGYVIGGHFESETTFAPGEKNETKLSYGSKKYRTHDAAFAKYSKDDVFVWARGMADSHSISLFDIIATRDSRIVVTGKLGYGARFNPDMTDETALYGDDRAYIATYDMDGRLLSASAGQWDVPEEESEPQYYGKYDATGFALSAGSRSGFSVAGQFMGLATFGSEGSSQIKLRTKENIQNSFFLTYR